MTEYKLALVGFGGVNRALAQLIAERNEGWKTELGFSLKIVGVTDLFLGSLVGREGLDAGVLARLPSQPGATVYQFRQRELARLVQPKGGLVPTHGILRLLPAAT